MNKKGGLGTMLKKETIFIILLVIFFYAAMVFVMKERDSAKFWEQYYTSEIARVVDMSKPGDEIKLDVQKATEIAQANGVQLRDIFNFGNLDNTMRVKLSQKGSTEFKFYNDVNIFKIGENGGIELGVSDGINKLVFAVKEASENGAKSA